MAYMNKKIYEELVKRSNQVLEYSLVATHNEDDCKAFEKFLNSGSDNAGFKVLGNIRLSPRKTEYFAEDTLYNAKTGKYETFEQAVKKLCMDETFETVYKNLYSLVEYIYNNLITEDSLVGNFDSDDNFTSANASFNYCCFEGKQVEVDDDLYSSMIGLVMLLNIAKRKTTLLAAILCLKYYLGIDKNVAHIINISEEYKLDNSTIECCLLDAYSI